MANLLPRPAERTAFSALDPERLERFDARLRLVIEGRAPRPDLAGCRERFEEALEELESEVSLPALESLLAEIDCVRRDVAREGQAEGHRVRRISEANADPPAARGPDKSHGGLICYWPGRSLATGEAEVASRGFFDARDRPPVFGWLTAIARPHANRARAFEVAVVAWVSSGELERARAGRRACPSGALAWLEEASPELWHQLAPRAGLA